MLAGALQCSCPGCEQPLVEHIADRPREPLKRRPIPASMIAA